MKGRLITIGKEINIADGDEHPFRFPDGGVEPECVWVWTYDTTEERWGRLEDAINGVRDYIEQQEQNQKRLSGKEPESLLIGP